MSFNHATGALNSEGYSFWPAPAKLNLELRILGRRDDGYHELQTLFQLLDYGDEIWIKPNDSGEVTLQSEYDEVPSDDNLIIKAARSLEPYKQDHQGADIKLEKKLPSGAGLGGGSSDAATTLVALNNLWSLGLQNEQLCEIGKSLGADVPVFVNGKTAWAEGIGEILSATELPEKHYLIVYPDVKINTSKIFSHRALTRDNKPIKLRATRTEASLELGYNAFEPLVAELYPEVREALEFLGEFGKATLTGTGSCVFLTFDNEREVRKIAALCKQRWLTLTARGINTSPLI
ncbi:4-(cytidine 5'-diphospho)-2-C-methyl-D-erythritol kinase [Kangiella japonica]|uniref:4-diphosphocytidyl-2-C-methyl-D-erythritol kinase n=1 Tax=Kangiella japonica TaxID=647384 RepID=A0ABN0SUG2_9GAMM